MKFRIVLIVSLLTLLSSCAYKIAPESNYYNADLGWTGLLLIDKSAEMPTVSVVYDNGDYNIDRVDIHNAIEVLPRIAQINGSSGTIYELPRGTSSKVDRLFWNGRSLLVLPITRDPRMPRVENAIGTYTLDYSPKNALGIAAHVYPSTLYTIDYDTPSCIGDNDSCHKFFTRFSWND